MTERIRIGELAARCGVTRDTIRFYEREGLLPRPRRTASRHRVYDGRAEEQVRFIRRSQVLGLSLGDIRRLLPLRESGAAACHRAAEILRARLDAYEERIATFDRFRELLKEGLGRCDESGSGSCRLLVDLSRVDSGFPQPGESGPPSALRGVAGR